MAHILVMDDEDDVLASISDLLQKASYTVCLATNGQEGLDKLIHEQPDLVVLDIIMPGMDGITVCQRIRADPFMGRLPIIFLSAKGRSQDVARGLDAGGDDYLVKPFDVLELPARIRALLRRIPGGSLDPEAQELVIGQLKLGLVSPEVYVGEDSVQVTPTEYRLLYYLMSHAGQPMPAEQLLERVWEYPPGVGDPQLPRVHINRLRAKLGLSPDDPEYIQNLHGRGYLIAK